MRIVNIKSLPVLIVVVSGSMAYMNLASAHGYLQDPPARSYFCKNGGANSQGCQAIIASGQSETLDTPQQNVYQAPDYRDYERVLPDGQICSAKGTYNKLDLPANLWSSKAVTPNANGEIPFTYYFSAHHTTDHIRYYITRQGSDNTQPVKWSDLIELATFPAVAKPANGSGTWTENIKLPSGISGKHVVVTMWPVSTSHGTNENFVSCSDVDIQGNTEQPETGWTAIGAGVSAHQPLKKGDKTTLRVFANGAPAGSYTKVVADDKWGSPANWLYDLARYANQQNLPVKMGDTLENGEVKITKVQSQYNVYTTDRTVDYTYTIDIQQENLPVTGNPPVAVITPSATTISHAETTTLDASQSSDADGTPASQLNYKWSVIRNAEQVELTSGSGITTQVRLKAPATSEFDVVVALEATDPEGNIGESNLVLKAKPASVTPPPGGSWDSNKVYAQPCEKVTFNGSEWINGWWTQGNQPGADGEWGVWRKAGVENMHSQCQ